MSTILLCLLIVLPRSIDLPLTIGFSWRLTRITARIKLDFLRDVMEGKNNEHDILYIYSYIYIYIYIYVCVCVYINFWHWKIFIRVKIPDCIFVIYIYIYIYICVCVCVYIYIYIYIHQTTMSLRSIGNIVYTAF